MKAKLIDFSVRGMTCAACSSAVERALRDIPGVMSAVVNLPAERATVEFMPEMTGFEAFSAVIKEAGYSAEQITEEFIDREREQRDTYGSDHYRKHD